MDCATLEWKPDLAAVDLDCLESHVQCRLGARVRQLRLCWRDGGLVLHGLAPTYYAKQLAQHALMAATKQPIRANEIEVV
jgi:hypothetical protein